MLILGVVWGIGLLDDLKGTSPYLRLAVDFGCGAAFWLLGWKLQWFSNPYLDFLATMAFLTFVINSMNMLDGMDGLALTVSGIASIGFIVLFSGQPLGFASGLAWSLAGRLRGNVLVQPASGSNLYRRFRQYFAGSSSCVSCFGLGAQRFASQRFSRALDCNSSSVCWAAASRRIGGGDSEIAREEVTFFWRPATLLRSSHSPWLERAADSGCFGRLDNSFGDVFRRGHVGPRWVLASTFSMPGTIRIRWALIWARLKQKRTQLVIPLGQHISNKV